MPGEDISAGCLRCHDFTCCTFLLFTGVMVMCTDIVLIQKKYNDLPAAADKDVVVFLWGLDLGYYWLAALGLQILDFFILAFNNSCMWPVKAEQDAWWPTGLIIVGMCTMVGATRISSHVGVLWLGGCGLFLIVCGMRLAWTIRPPLWTLLSNVWRQIWVPFVCSIFACVCCVLEDVLSGVKRVWRVVSDAVKCDKQEPLLLKGEGEEKA
jgi:hypothetical protein